jgi:serine/threonine protein kinase
VKFGDQVGPFGVLKKLSQGGMAAVYLGFDPRNNGFVALKVLFLECVEDPVFVQRFHREVSILEQLAHRHIVGLVDRGECDGQPYAALEYVRGTPLSDLIQHGAMATERAIPIVRAVAKALSHANAFDVVHRDIKPSNIIVGDGPEEVKVVDFGVAHAKDDLVTTSAGQFLGSMCYAAPEQMEAVAVDHRTDLYALGVVFYEMLTGRLPFQDTNPTTIRRQQSADLYMPPSQFAPGLPREIDAMVLKLLRGDPRLRYESAEVFLRDLDQVEARSNRDSVRCRSIYDLPEQLKKFREANSAYEARDLDRSLALAEDLAVRAPRAPEVFYLLGQTHIARGFAYNGIRELEKATALDAENAFYHITLGQAYESMGMFDKAHSAYTAAMRSDPDSRVAQQKLEAVEARRHGGAPEAAAAGPEAAPQPPPGGPSPAPPVEEAPPPAPFKMPRLSVPGRLTLAAPMLLWWGAPFAALGGRAKAFWATLAQLAMAAIAWLVKTQALAVLRTPVHERGAMAFLADHSNVAILRTLPYVLFMLVLLRMALRDARLLKLQGHVTGQRQGRRWVVWLDIGRDRGIRGREVFQIYKEEARGSASGRLAGQVAITDVGETTCWGEYLPHMREAPAPGDYAVAVSAVRAGLVRPGEPCPLRFPQIDQQAALAAE